MHLNSRFKLVQENHINTMIDQESLKELRWHERNFRRKAHEIILRVPL